GGDRTAGLLFEFPDIGRSRRHDELIEPPGEQKEAEVLLRAAHRRASTAHIIHNGEANVRPIPQDPAVYPRPIPGLKGLIDLMDGCRADLFYTEQVANRDL